MLTKACFLFALSLVSLSVNAASHNAEEMLASFRGKPDEGEQIVAAFCGNCHAEKPLIELGAPKPGVDQDWSRRLQQGLDSLFQHTSEGYGAMPPRGGCFECTDEQLRLAIEAMLPKKRTKKSK